MPPIRDCVFLILALMLVGLAGGCSPKREDLRASVHRQYSKPTIAGTSWSSTQGAPNLEWLPAEFSGGDIEFRDHPDGVVLAITIRTPMLSDDSKASLALKVYEETKQALTRRYGQPSSADEHNYYSQHTGLGDCLRRQVPTPNDIAPSCQWQTTWFSHSTSDGTSLWLEITPGNGRVELRQYIGTSSTGTRSRVVPIGSRG